MHTKGILTQYLVYNLGGFTSYMLSIFVTWSIVQLVGAYHSWAYAIALIVCYFYLGLYHYFITFRPKITLEKLEKRQAKKNNNLFTSMINFSIIFVVFAYINIVLADIFIYTLHMHYILGITIAGFIISIITFGINKRFVFTNSHDKRHFAQKSRS